MDPTTSAAAPPRGPSWRKRHPVLARVVLYGGALVLLAAGAAVGLRLLEEARQQGLLTRINGAELIRTADPASALRILRHDVLAKDPDDDVGRRAELGVAAALDALARYAEAEAAYADLDGRWPAGIPRGSLVVPWANMRVSAGRAREALALLDRPGATEGWPVGGAEGSSAVRERATRAASEPVGRGPGR